jgi:hypothetical protein
LVPLRVVRHQGVVVVQGGIFINYRGTDSHSYGALLHTELSRHFGSDLVFLDSESIPAGADFVEQLLGRVRQARVVLAVIGTHWLAATGPGGERRLDDPADWIRRELEEAFAAGVRVIPVLTDDAQMPTEADLPADLTPLARCQYRRLRHRDASTDLSRLVGELATTDEELGAAARRQGGVPQQLPAATAHFAGRAGELATLTRLLRGRADTGGTVVISAVSGTAGVGKTALAVHWAHQVADRFPDGQLYVNLRGFDPGGQVMAPAEAVRRFLDALQVPPERIPVELDAQAALYRSQLAGKRMLVVLDNARDAEQVRPLLPGTPTALVVVTSRNRLSSLVAVDGAHSLMLDLLTEGEARELLAGRLGPDRVAAEPDAVEQIIACCVRLPLALSIAGARAEQSGFPLAALAAELDKASGRLDVLDAGDAVSQVRAVFSWSYTALPPAARRLFRLLGLHPGPDISAAATASLAAVPPAATRQLLAELVRANLLTEHTPCRYTLHDLLRAYATDLAHTHDPTDHRRATVGRILDHYLHTAHTANRLLDPTRDPITLALAPPGPGVAPEQPADDGQALAWLTTEHPVLLAAVRQAAGAGFDTHTWQLTWTLHTFLNRRGHWRDLTTTWQTALPAARRLDHPATQAHAHRGLAWAHAAGNPTAARTAWQHALDILTDLNHPDADSVRAKLHSLDQTVTE